MGPHILITSHPKQLKNRFPSSSLTLRPWRAGWVASIIIVLLVFNRVLVVIVAVVIGVVVVQVVSRCRARHNNIGSVPQLIDY